MSDRGANTGDLGPPELSKLEYVNKLLSRLRFVGMTDSVGDESTKQMLSLLHVSQGFLLVSQRGGIVEAGWERERAIAAHRPGPNPGSIIYQSGGFLEVPAPHLQWGMITLALG